MQIDSTKLDQMLYKIIRPLLCVTGERVTRNTEDIQKQIVVNEGNNDRKTLFMATDGRSMAAVTIREPYALFYAAHALESDIVAKRGYLRPLAIPLETLPRMKAGEHIEMLFYGNMEVGGKMRDMVLGLDDQICPPGPTRYLTKELKKEFGQLKQTDWEDISVVKLPWIKGGHHWMSQRIIQGLSLMRGTITHIYLTRRHRLFMGSWYKGRHYQYVVVPIVPNKK